MRADSGNNEGTSTVASGSNSHAEGQSTAASGVTAHAQGLSTTASGSSSHAEGQNTSATASCANASGSRSLASRFSQRAHAGGQFAAVGDAQKASLVLLVQTTANTPTVLTGGGAILALTGDAINVLTLPASRAFQLKISTVARRTDVQGEMAGWTWEGLVGRDSTGNARIIGTPLEAAWGDAAANLWALAVSINTVDATNNYVAVTATGEVAKTIRWVSKLEWVEVGS